MSSSYFDAQPAKAQPPAALLDVPQGSDFGNMGLLSPQVSRILDDLELDERSSSEDDNVSLSWKNSNPNQDTSHDRESRRDLSEQDYSIRKAQTSPLPRGKMRVQVENQLPSRRPGSNSQKHPHLARFHSLRSALFSSHIEDNIQKCNESRMQEQAEAKWRAEHSLRRGLNRPKISESLSPPREGLGKRLKLGLKRMTSKDSPPSITKISEDNTSTASDDEGEQAYYTSVEDINHSDIEDLVRWVSKRDPPSDGEARKLKGNDTGQISKTDSGHESLGYSDVEDLVRWVSRKNEPQPRASQNQHVAPPAEIVQRGHSDMSTESDSEAGIRSTIPSHRKESMDEDDVDELVRWVSRKRGPNAGPVRKKEPAPAHI